jgi:hypothetical protein
LSCLALVFVCVFVHRQAAYETRPVDHYLYVLPTRVFSRQLADRTTPSADGNSLCFLPALGQMVINVGGGGAAAGRSQQLRPQPRGTQPQMLVEQTMAPSFQAVFGRLDRRGKGLVPAHELAR